MWRSWFRDAEEVDIKFDVLCHSRGVGEFPSHIGQGNHETASVHDNGQFRAPSKHV